MADLAAADLTYTLIGRTELDNLGNKVSYFAITTAAGEYPTGGLPLTNGKLGCPTNLISLDILENDVADAKLTYHYDRSANKIVVVEDDVTTGVPAEHANATFTDPDELVVRAIGY